MTSRNSNYQLLSPLIDAHLTQDFFGTNFDQTMENQRVGDPPHGGFDPPLVDINHSIGDQTAREQAAHGLAMFANQNNNHYQRRSSPSDEDGRNQNNPILPHGEDSDEEEAELALLRSTYARERAQADTLHRREQRRNERRQLIADIEANRKELVNLTPPAIIPLNGNAQRIENPPPYESSLNRGQHASNGTTTNGPDVTLNVLERLVTAITGAQQNSGPKPAIFKEKPPIYNGQTDESVTWLKEYECVAEKNNWRDKEKVLNLTSAFGPTVKTWYRGLYDTSTPEWKQFKADFLSAYKLKGYVHSIRRNFYTLRQGFTEKPTDFLNKLLNMRHQIIPKPTDEELVECLKAGLSPKYAAHIHKDTDLNEIRSTLDELYRLNEVQERARQNRPPVKTHIEETRKETTRPMGHQDKSSEFKPTCFNCGRTGHMSASCRDPFDPVKFRENRERINAARNGRVVSSLPPHLRRTSGQTEQKLPIDSRRSQVDHRPTINENRPTDTMNGQQGESRAFETTDLPVKPIAYKTLRVPVLFGTVRKNALIDTGGSFSLISAALAIDHQITVEPYLGARLIGTGNTAVTPIGLVRRACIGLCGNMIELPLTVIDQLEPHLILGIDFIRAMRLSIDFAAETLSISRVIDTHSDGELIKQWGKAPVYPTRPMNVFERYLMNRTEETVPKPTTAHIRKLGQEGHQRPQRRNSYSDPKPNTSLTNDNVMIIPNIESRKMFDEDSDSLSTSEENSGDSSEEYAEYIEGVLAIGRTFLPYQEQQIQITLKRSDPKGNCFVEMHPDCSFRQLSMHEGVCQFVAQSTTIVLKNNSPEEVQVPTGELIVRMSAITDILVEPRNPSKRNRQGKEGKIPKRASFANFEISQGEQTHKVRPSNKEIEQFISHFNVGPQLNDFDRLRLGHLLHDYRDRFVFKGDALGQVVGQEHVIETIDEIPVSQPPYRVSHAERKIIEDQVQDMLDQGIIVPIKSSWTSPLVIVSKRDKTARLCCDYRLLNKKTKTDNFPLPRIDDILDLLGNADTYSTMDAYSAYWQIRMHPDSIEKTTFVCHLGTFAFNFMPFGLRNAPATMSRAMADIFHEENRKICIVYLDDCIAYSKGFNYHLKNLELVFQRMRANDLKLKPSKCFFGQTKVSFLGHQISANGVIPDPDRTQTIREYQTPTTVRDIRAFLGFFGYYRRFINNFAQIAQPLNLLLRKDQRFIWSDRQQNAFDTLRDCVLNPPVLCHFDPTAELYLRTDASGYGLGGHLVQVPKGKPRSEGRLLACMSRTVSKTQSRYTVSELECLAIVYAIEKFRPYLFGKKFTIETDHHALCFLMKIRNPNGRLCHWALKLQTYEFDVVYNAGKNHADADCLSRYPLNTTFADLDKESEEDLLLKPMSLAFNQNEPRVYDSDTIIDTDYQMSSLAAVSSACEPATDIEGKMFRKTELEHYQLTDINYWQIFRAFSNNTADKEFGSAYMIVNDLLYKEVTIQRNKRYVICVPQAIVPYLLNAYHDDKFSGHMGQTKTYFKLREKYIWPNMYREVTHYVRSCAKCQRYKHSKNRSQGLYQPLPVPELPFRHIAMDLIGPMPVTVNDNLYILTIACRMTKFAYARALPDLTDRSVMKALFGEYVYLYGIPETILTDRGTNLCSKYSEEMYDKHGVKHITTTSWRPESNGSLERFNGYLTTNLAMYTNGKLSLWDEHLKEAVYSYNTAPNVATGYTPYYLAFGCDGRHKADNKLGHQDLAFNPKVRDEQVVHLYNEREQAKRNNETLQGKNKKRTDKTRKEVNFEIGDKVLLEKRYLKLMKGGKLLPKYYGPYFIVNQIGPVTYRITKRSGDRVATVHVNRLKKFHEVSKENMANSDMDSKSEIDSEPFSDWTEDYSTNDESPGASRLESCQSSSETESEPPANDRPLRNQRIKRRPAYWDDFVHADN